MPAETAADHQLPSLSVRTVETWDAKICGCPERAQCVVARRPHPDCARQHHGPRTDRQHRRRDAASSRRESHPRSASRVSVPRPWYDERVESPTRSQACVAVSVRGGVRGDRPGHPR